MPESRTPRLESAMQSRRSIPYRPSLNRLTGSMSATILLQQIVYRWLGAGREPFSKYMAPCPKALPGDSWLEELGFTRHQFLTARARIAKRIRTKDSKHEARKKFLVVYYGDKWHNTWYEVNESLLMRRLAELDVQKGRSKPVQKAFPKPRPNCRPEDRRTKAGKRSRVSDPKSGVRYTEKSHDFIDMRYLDQEKEQAAPAEDREDLGVGSTVEQVPEAARIWEECLDDLRCQMTKDTFDTWLQDTRGLEVVDGALHVEARDEYARDWLDNRLRRKIEKTVEYVASDLSVAFVVAS